MEQESKKKDFDLTAELQSNDLVSQVLAIVDLDPLTREQERKRISKKFNVRKSVIDEFIKGFKKGQEAGGTAEIVTEVEPFKDEVDGAVLLNTIAQKIKQHVILPDGAVEPIAVWCLLTYSYEAFRILPLLGIVSPRKRCGKTTLLETLQGLVNKSLIASNISPAAVYRTIEKYSPTLLVDELDTFIKDNNELRGVLNSGHTRKSAYVVRLVGDNHEPVKFSTWGPKAVSMIGVLPSTLRDRAIVIKLKRKTPNESAVKLSIDFEDDCIEIRRKCRRWADNNLRKLSTTSPNMPRTNNDRMADNWMPLFAIAEAVGGDWPELVKDSMMKMLDVSDDEISQMLLEDIQDIFNSNGVERMFSGDLVEALKKMSERPWCDWNRGKGLTQNGLAKLLKPDGISSKDLRIDDKIRKGYELDSFKDAFKRYITTLPPDPLVQSATPLQYNNIKYLHQNQSATKGNHVADEKHPKLLKLNDCSGVADGEEGIEEDKIYNSEGQVWTDETGMWIDP